jgi:hypothetical protein
MNLTTDRRKFLRNSALAGMALAAPPFMRGAAVSSSHRFDLTADSNPFNEGATAFRSKVLKNPYSKIQAIGFDYVNNDVYLVQTTGAEKDGNSESYHLAHGDLTIVKTNLSGTMSSYMYLNNCGHGAGIGVQTNGSDTEPWIWLECDPLLASNGDAFGTKIFRFVWAPNTELTFGSSTPHTHNLKPGTTINNPSIDIAYNNLALRYHDSSNVIRYAIYDIDQIISGPYTSWVEFPQPNIVNTAGTFQGFALFGEYLYTLNGSSEPSGTCPGTQSEGEDYPITLTAINVNNGDTWQSQLNAGYTIGEREPEGMAIYMDTSGALSSALLCFGLAGYTDGCPSPLTWAASIYYKGTQI